MGKVEVKVGKTPEGYSATIELLPGLIVGVTGNFADLKKEIIESIEFYIDCAKKDNEPYPSVFDGEYELTYQFDVVSLLYCYEKVLSRAALERITGINQKQLSHYACGRSKPRPQQAQKIIDALHSLGQDLVAISI